MRDPTQGGLRDAVMAEKDDKKKGAADAKPKGDAKPKADKAPAAGGEKKKSGGRRAGAGAAALAKPVSNTAQDKVTPRLRTKYETDVIPALIRQFGYKNKMEVPRLTKITVNMGLGEA